MKRILIASSSPHVFSCVFIALFLHATSIAPGSLVRAARTVVPAEPGGRLIRIWTVGSPHTNSLPPAVIPPELLQRAESLGYTIQIEAFRPEGFAAHFHQALQNHTEPEILTFDNYGVLSGIQTRLGSFQGIDWDRRTASSLALVHETMTSLQPIGWVMLVPSASNYEAARTLAMRLPECDARTGPGTFSQDILTTLREAREKAVSATRAYLDCDRSALAEVSDKSRMVQQCFMPQSETKAESVRACSVSGNHKLAFISLVSAFSGKVRDPRALNSSKPGMNLGQQSILVVLTNQSGTWRVLAITHDSVNTRPRIPVTTNTFVISLDHGPLPGIMPEPARLLTPNGVYPASQNGQPFGDFIWEPSSSTDVIGQVAEFMWGRETNWGLTRLFFLRSGENKISSGLLMTGGTTLWRVWTINKSGDVVLSEQHSFKYCPCPAICRDWP
jgi:hypothetical protein